MAQVAAKNAPVVTMKQLLEAGVHFGHQTRRWNPKMKRFIFGERNGIYIIDLQQTLERIDTAYRFVRNTVENGGTVLFVGTKKQAQEPIQKQADRSNSPYVNYRWLGGMLTNFQTVHARVAKLHELERLVATGETEQMIKKEGLKVKRELDKLERNLGGIRNLERAPERRLRDRHEEGAHRRHRGEPARHPGDRGRRHQLRSRRHRLRDPRQRRRHPLRQPDEPHRRRRGDRGSVAAPAQERTPGTAAVDAKPAPPAEAVEPEEQAAKEEAQAQARAAAAAAQREREARRPPTLAAEGRLLPPADAPADAPPEGRRTGGSGADPRFPGEHDRWLTSRPRTSRRCARRPARG